MRRRGRPRRKHLQMEVVNPNAAGIDIGSEVHYVAVPPDRATEPLRSFKCFTADLHSLAAGMESEIFFTKATIFVVSQRKEPIIRRE